MRQAHSYLKIEHSIKESLHRLSLYCPAFLDVTGRFGMFSKAMSSASPGLQHVSETYVDIKDTHHAQLVKKALNMPVEHALWPFSASPSESKVRHFPL